MTHQPFFIPAIIFLVGSLPLILGLVPRNKIYGVRTEKTLSDPAVWVKANRFGGVAILISSLVYIGIAMFFPSLGEGANSPTWWIHLGSFVLPLVVALVVTGKYARGL